jgi:hypothetical protein
MEYADRRGYAPSETGRGEVEVVNNLDWTKGLGMLEFLRTVGKVARVNIMLSRDRYDCSCTPYHHLLSLPQLFLVKTRYLLSLPGSS